MRKIRVGLVGLGRAGRHMHAAELALHPDRFEVVAVCDADAERRRGLPPVLADARVYADAADLVADGSVELVSIATRNADHTPQALAALAAGKFVVVEKPVAVDMAQATALRDADRRYPGKIFLRHNRRFEPAFNAVLGQMARGVLGRVGLVKLGRCPGFVRRMDWQTLTECHGGMLSNWGPHLIDQALRLLESPVVDVWCDLQNRVSLGDADDQVKLLLRGANGRVADVEIFTANTLPGPLYEVRGDRGTLVVPVEEDVVRLRYLDPARRLERRAAERGCFPLVYGNPHETLHFIEEEIPIAPPGGHTLQRGRVLAAGEKVDRQGGYTHQDTMWDHVYRAVVDGIDYPVTVEEGVEVVRVSEWARRQSGYRPGPSSLSASL